MFHSFSAAFERSEIKVAKIGAVVVEGDREKGYKRIQVLFGTNSFIEISDDDGLVHLLVGAHDRGFIVDGSEPSGALARLIEEVVKLHPEQAWREAD
jgi:hypothetical protein